MTRIPLKKPLKTVKPITVGELMRIVFPLGYLDHDRYAARLRAVATKKPNPLKLNTTFSAPPASAVDLFALAGMLLFKGGAYHHVVSDDPTSASRRTLLVSAADRERWIEAGRAWRGEGQDELPPPPPALTDAWAVLQSHMSRSVFRSVDMFEDKAPWWQAALALFVIADEAAADIGFTSLNPTSAQSRYIELPIRRTMTLDPEHRGPYTLSKADRDQVCVLPKSRTPQIGCTIRSLSHHLSLLPARGLARAHWTLSPENTSVGEPGPFNVVIIPHPFVIHATAFKGRRAGNEKWGWFEVEPHWCPRSSTKTKIPRGFGNFASFVEQVLDKAAEDSGTVHAVIFPEGALSSRVFRLLCDRLKTRPGLELMIGGLFDNIDTRLSPPTVRHGNFTGMARFVRSGKGTVNFNVSIREKHHRWQLDDAQIETYALGSALDINMAWWEQIDILSRSLDVFVLRGNATVTTLICEDLARSDPCQELVRGIGPNFLVALLMDGPQRTDRWPARYGTVLADDPGSSVLTVTSLGLIGRSNATKRYPVADQIGLFRDDRGHATELRLPPGAQAICMTLQPSELTEFTMDGRSDGGGAQSWRLGGVVPITITTPNSDIMAGGWPKPAPKPPRTSAKISPS